MIGLVIVGVLILMLAVPAAGWIRSKGRDEKSIEAHRSTLGVIEHAAGADEQPERWRHRSAAHVRVVGTPVAVPRPAEEGEVWRPSGRRSRRPSFPSRREITLQPPELPVAPATMDRNVARLLAATQARRTAGADAEASAATPTVESRPASAPGPASGRRSSGWLSPPSTGPHLPVVLASLAAALIMAAVIGVALNPHKGAPSRPAAAAPAHRAATGGPAAPPSSTAPPPPPPSVVATSANSSNAAYTVNATALDVELVAAGQCWVELRDGTASGPVVFEGTLRSGVSQVFHAVGAIWLRLGDPAGVKMSIDGSSVALPASTNPFDVSVSSPTGA